jgi:hypothetical protein
MQAVAIDERLVAGAHREDEAVVEHSGQRARCVHHRRWLALPDNRHADSQLDALGLAQQERRHRERIAADHQLSDPECPIAELLRFPDNPRGVRSAQILNRAYHPKSF